MRPLDTVMHSVVPSKDGTGWAMKAFGRCDVAALQERYGLPTMATRVSTCNDINTAISLGSSVARVRDGEPVTFRAVLRTVDLSAYGQLGGIRLNRRSVQLRRRLAGLGGGWSVFWMKPDDNEPGTYVLTMHPSGNYEFQAAFPRPDDEGLNGDTSNVISVRVIDACTSLCPDVEDQD
jgi:hypothetical protein